MQPDDGTVEVTEWPERYDFEEDGSVTYAFENGAEEAGTWRFAGGEEAELLFDAGRPTERTADVLELSASDLRLPFGFSAVGRDVAMMVRLAHP